MACMTASDDALILINSPNFTGRIAVVPCSFQPNLVGWKRELLYQIYSLNMLLSANPVKNSSSSQRSGLYEWNFSRQEVSDQVMVRVPCLAVNGQP